MSTVLRVGYAPVKGLRHLDLPAAEVDAEGVVGDRACAFVDPATMSTLKSAENGRLVRVVGHVANGVVHVLLPDGSRCSQSLDGGVPHDISYWGRPVRARLADGEVADAVSRFLGRRVLLAAAPARRSFVWDSPVSVVLVAELRELGGRLGVDLSGGLGRYRSNLVLDASVQVGDVFEVGSAVLEALGEIERCAVMDQHPLTGERDLRVLSELARYRRTHEGIVLGLRCRVVRPGIVRPHDPVDIGHR